jgi:hypothetical protein
VFGAGRRFVAVQRLTTIGIGWVRLESIRSDDLGIPNGGDAIIRSPAANVVRRSGPGTATGHPSELLLADWAMCLATLARSVRDMISRHHKSTGERITPERLVAKRGEV